MASMFDVAHNARLSTALYVSKERFSLFQDSYDANSGNPHANGRNKIDYYFWSSSDSGADKTAQPVVDELLSDMEANIRHLAMLHIFDPDAAGHNAGWMSAKYLSVVAEVDGMLARIFDLIETKPAYAGRTSILLPSDHGGVDLSHHESGIAQNYTIPFYVWGPGVTAGADLYDLNVGGRLDPLAGAPDNFGMQPVRNGDVTNLALSRLGLGPVPASVINVDPPLLVPEPHSLLAFLALPGLVRRRRIGG